MQAAGCVTCKAAQAAAGCWGESRERSAGVILEAWMDAGRNGWPWSWWRCKNTEQAHAM